MAMSQCSKGRPLELWGGVECTVNRVGDAYRDQSEATGHAVRVSDLELIARLGVTGVRYPVIWEKISPHAADEADWNWTDARLSRLRDFGVDVIAGLVHHGSGPRYAGILTDAFAPGLAAHAAAVARRYPWVRRWTPVNEPLTTARFCALYGHWHPHERSERAFWLAVLNQVDATRAAMRAVRKVNADAELVATDDLGLTYATNAIRKQAQHDNNRRWMSWDLLCGRVVPGHPFYIRLCDFGFADRLHSLADDPCPPSIVGVNHYLTSDRFLDHRVDNYPPHLHGGNGREPYADTEAARVLEPYDGGWETALRETWERYRLPVAITEVHNGCTREEQLRWFVEAWNAAQRVRSDGADIRAVTAWALFGSRDWNTLLTARGVYEPGVWDASSGTPRPTAMVPLLQTLAKGGRPEHPALDQPGWWRRPTRLAHGTLARPAPVAAHLTRAAVTGTQPLLIVGRTGTLGQALARECIARDLPFVLAGRDVAPLDDRARLAELLDCLQPWGVINAAGWVRVDDAEAEADGCYAANTRGALALGEEAARRRVPTVSFSSDLVFDGQSARAYREGDAVRPLGVYGASKAALESGVATLPGRHLMLRTAAFFSPDDPYNFAWAVAHSLWRNEPFAASALHQITPTYTPDLARATLDLLLDEADGLWHMTSGEAMSWAGFARRVADACTLDRSLIRPLFEAPPEWRARRPLQAAMTSTRGRVMPSFEHALERFAATMTAKLPV